MTYVATLVVNSDNCVVTSIRSSGFRLSFSGAFTVSHAAAIALSIVRLLIACKVTT